MDTNDWLHGLTDGATPRQVADKTGLSERTLRHQLTTGRMSVENAVKISAAYGRHPLRTLIDFGIVDAAWAQVPDIDAALDLAPDDKLIEQLEKRLKRADAMGRAELFDTPISELPSRHGGKDNLETSSTFTPERSKNESGVADDDDDDGTVRDFDWAPGTYAADSTIDEGKAREERGEDPID